MLDLEPIKKRLADRLNAPVLEVSLERDVWGLIAEVERLRVFEQAWEDERPPRPC